MRRFKYLIQTFENLTIFRHAVTWGWLAFVVMPGWAAESKSVPSQTTPASTSCKQVDDQVVKKWIAEVQKFHQSLPNMVTRGGGERDISSPLLFPVRSPQQAKFLAGKRKIYLAWEGGQANYTVKVFPSGEARDWIKKPDPQKILQETKMFSDEKEFKPGNYWVVVTDRDDNESKWKFTVVDRESQPFFKQFEEIQKETSLNEVQKKWRLVVLLLSYGEEWKLEAYQQIAELPREKEKEKIAEQPREKEKEKEKEKIAEQPREKEKEKEKDEFYWAWLGIKDEVWPKKCQGDATK